MTEPTSDGIAHVDEPSKPGGESPDWILLAEQIILAGEALSAEATVDGGHAATVARLALLARSIGHMRAALVLVGAGRFVEGRIIVRNLIENLFLAAGLSRDSAATWEKLSADRRASRSKRGKLIKENADFFSPDHIARLDAYMETLAKGHQLNPRSVAEDNSLEQAYLFYAQLSADSAHASLDALERHLTTDEHGRWVELSLEPKPDLDECRDTVGWGSMALLGVLVESADLAGANGPAVEQVNAVGESYLRLTRGPAGPSQ